METEEQQFQYHVFDGTNLIKVYSDQGSANRRVFAENCSYRKKALQTWHLEKKPIIPEPQRPEPSSCS
jgi:hypothetical protein